LSQPIHFKAFFYTSGISSIAFIPSPNSSCVILDLQSPWEWAPAKDPPPPFMRASWLVMLILKCSSNKASSNKYNVYLLATSAVFVFGELPLILVLWWRCLTESRTYTLAILSTFMTLVPSRSVKLWNRILSPTVKQFARQTFIHPDFSLLCRCPPCKTHSYCTSHSLPSASRRDTTVRKIVLLGAYRAAPGSCMNKVGKKSVSGAPKKKRCASDNLMCTRRR